MIRQLAPPRARRCIPPGVAAAVTVGIEVLVGLTLWGLWPSDPPPLRMLDVAVAAVGLALVPVLLRWPVAGALALAVLAAVSPVATPPSTVGTLHVARFCRFRVALAVALAGTVAHIIRGLWRPVGGLPFGWWVVLVVVAHAALLGWGTWSQARQAVLSGLRDRAERAEAEQARRVAEAKVAERGAIAREMHDVLAHRLSLLAAYAGAMEYRPDAPPEQLAEAAGVIRDGAHRALAELREVISVLRSDDDVESDQPQPALADLADLVEETRLTGTAVDYASALSGSPPPTVGRTAYRVVQEALTNARKHAAGQPVRVRVTGAAGGRLEIEVTNPRTPGASTVPGARLGLVGLTERVRLAGGELDQRATPEDFRLHAWLPWPA